MQISEIGANALIDRLTASFEGFDNRDDAALFDLKGMGVTATHLMLEGVHFDLRYMPVHHLGYKAVATTLSNLAAMNATPAYISVAIGVTAQWEVEDLETLYKGIRVAAERFGVKLLGGDTAPSVAGFTIAVTAIGSADPDTVVCRKGAAPNDLICVSGNLGAAYMGLKALEREQEAYDGSSDYKHDLGDRTYLLERQLTPQPRFDIMDMLSLAGVKPTSMIDVTKGIARDLLALSQASGVGMKLYEERLPIDYETASMAEEIGINVFSAALYGGEDYELLFTVPLGFKDVIEQMEGIAIVGYVTEPGTPALLITQDGREVELKEQE